MNKFGKIAGIVFVALLFVACNKGKKIETVDNDTSIGDKHSFLVGIWTGDVSLLTEDKESTSSGVVTLTISENEGKYAYILETTKNVHKGFVEIEDGDEMFVTLPEIKWAEYRGLIPEGKELEDVPSEDMFGIGFVYDGETKQLMFQNYGNSMNYYVKIAEIDDKYIILEKNEDKN